MKIKPKPCKVCGSIDIKTYNCGYSSFNPVGGKCLTCGNIYTQYGSWDPSDNDCFVIWNIGQAPTELEKAKRTIKKLKAEVRALRKEIQANYH